jgi:hypothetical protein
MGIDMNKINQNHDLGIFRVFQQVRTLQVMDESRTFQQE